MIPPPPDRGKVSHCSVGESWQKTMTPNPRIEPVVSCHVNYQVQADALGHQANNDYRGIMVPTIQNISYRVFDVRGHSAVGQKSQPNSAVHIYIVRGVIIVTDQAGSKWQIVRSNFSDYEQCLMSLLRALSLRLHFLTQFYRLR